MLPTQFQHTDYSTSYSAYQSKQQEEEVERKITDWASQHPLFQHSNDREIITAFYNARMYNDADSLYKAGEYCRDHPELEWDIQAIFFFYESIEQRYKAKQSDPEMAQKIQVAQDNLDSMLLEGRGISKFDPRSTDRKTVDHCLYSLYAIALKQSDSRASAARYQLMGWYLLKSDFIPAVKYFRTAAASGSQSGKFGLQALISLLKDNPLDMGGWDEPKLMEHLNRRADRLMYSQSDEYAEIWSTKNRLSMYEQYYASGQGALELLELNANEDPNSAFLLYDHFRFGNLGVEPDQHKSQKYLDMAAQKNHTGAMQEYLNLWRAEKLLPEFNDIGKGYDYEDKIKKIQEDAYLVDMALKSLDDYESGRVQAPEYGPNIPEQVTLTLPNQDDTDPLIEKPVTTNKAISSDRTSV